MAYGKVKVDQIESSSQVLNVDDLLKGASIGTAVQAFDADLSAIAALSTSGLVSRTGAGTAAIVTLPSGDVVGTTATQTLTNKTLNNSTFTGTVSGVTATMVGLGSVDNTSDVNKPVSTATQTALDLKAPLASPTLTGTPLAPTATAGTSTTQIATTAFVGTAVADLVASAPATLNTLDELAAALGDDASYATSVATSLGLKAPLASPTFTGTVSGVTATMVGLGSVDNTSDVNKPVSTATQTALDLKAPLASPTFTGTVSGVTATMVGLGSVDNTSDVNKPVSTATQTALNLKADLASPTFTGSVTLNAQAPIRFRDADSSHYVALRCPSGVAVDLTWTLPSTDGAANQVLKTDGAGQLSWVALPSGSSMGMVIALG